MANLVFLLDYAPLLVKNHKSAMIIYEFYDKFKDDSGIVTIKYEELKEHLGLATSTISDAHNILKSLKLIEPLKQKDVKERKFQSVPYKVLPVIPLSENEDALKYVSNELNTEIQSNTQLKERFISQRLPEEFMVIFDVDRVKKVIEDLGEVKSQIANCLATSFGLDRNMFKVLMENKQFRQRFVEVKKLAQQQLKEKIQDQSKSHVSNTVNSNGKTINSDAAKFYEQLMEIHIDRKTKQERPISTWKSPQLLRYFCLCYEREYKTAYKFNGVSWSSKEMKDMKRILTAFDEDAQQAMTYIDWVFTIKIKSLNGIDSTGILAHARMINEFNRKYNGSKKKSISRNDNLPQDFLDWIKIEVPNIEDLADCTTYYDLYWLREEQLSSSDIADEIEKIINEAIRRGIVPSQGNIQF